LVVDRGLEVFQDQDNIFAASCSGLPFDPSAASEFGHIVTRIGRWIQGGKNPG
jgi:hypothetical protein